MNKIPPILEDLYLKNLKFFEKQNPQIHHVLKNTKPDHSKILINDDGKIDLKYHERLIYNHDAIKYAENEVAEFNDINKADKRINAIQAIPPEMYSAPRFFHRNLNNTIKKIYESPTTIHRHILHCGQRHDFLVVMGIGLGLHITELLERTDVQNLLILETDYELLALSCFFTDWEEIYKKQSTKLKKSISLVLVDKTEFDIEHGSLWNELTKRAPHFPFNSVFYNHGRHDKYGKIIKKISTDIKMYMSLWGFYDDETNQLNHILHNINRNIKLIPSKDSFKWDKPVIVCGSGPSFDSRIDQLKSIRSNCILISAGTSLPSLINNNIKPDYHIEIESDYAVYNALKKINHDDFLSDITLICALQCSPFITTLFKDTYAFVKDSMPTGDLIEKKENKLIEATPTCVNAALSMAFQYNAEHIYLFGTDFGFYSTDNHHSKHAIYNNDNINNEESLKLKEANQNNIKQSFKQKGYNGDCLTTDLYFTTKRRVDVAIAFNRLKYKFELYNCSDGLIIDHSTHIKESEEITIINTRNTSYNFKELSRQTNINTANILKEKFLPTVKKLCDLLLLNIKRMEENSESVSATFWAISNYLNTTFHKENGSQMYFLRGTIWHYMISGYSIMYACEPESQSEVIKLWKNGFIGFLEELPNDLKKELAKDRSSIYEDPQLTRTIKEPAY